MSYKVNQTTPRSRARRTVPLVLVVLVAAALLGGYAWHKHRTDSRHIVTASQATKGEPAATTANQNSTSTSAASNTSDGSEPGDQKSSSGGASAASLLDPTGNFVSNHHPGENGSPTSETSVCTTTPGATCAITFTKDGITKSLTAQTTDRGGSTYWNNWQPSDIGLTAGSWQVQAVVTLNGNSKMAADATALVVQ